MPHGTQEACDILWNSLHTWFNFRENLVCSRLDRFLFSCDWGDLYSQVRQEALVRVVSDHCPILLYTNPIKWGPTPFRFENMWFEHPDFKNNFKNWWEEEEVQGWEGYKFMSKLRGVKNKIKEWNKEAFSDIRLEKAAIVKRVNFKKLVSIVDFFGLILGLKINLLKSAVVGINSSREEEEEGLAREVGCEV